MGAKHTSQGPCLVQIHRVPTYYEVGLFLSDMLEKIKKELILLSKDIGGSPVSQVKVAYKVDALLG